MINPKDPLSASDMLKEVGRIGYYADGNYMCRCAECERMFIGDKRAVNCLPCAIASLIAAPYEAVIAEREACAAIAIGFSAQIVPSGTSVAADVTIMTAEAIAAAIRARGGSHAPRHKCAADGCEAMVPRGRGTCEKHEQSENKKLDGRGRCCGRKPIVYRRPVHRLFCARCNAEFTPEGAQKDNWAYGYFGGLLVRRPWVDVDTK